MEHNLVQSPEERPLLSIDSHEKDNLNPQQAAERICKYFSSISQTYEPLNVSDLPQDIQDKISDRSEDPPVLETHEIYENFKRRTPKNSKVLGDFPPNIKKEFYVELAEPVKKIFNGITASGNYPKQWKIEYVTPIGKVPRPETEDQIRPISLTSDLS